MERDVRDAKDCVGDYMMTVTGADPSPEAEARWAERIEVIANWLLEQWRSERQEAA